MAGRMGGHQVTALNLEVVSADPERELVLVKGAVPGVPGRRWSCCGTRSRRPRRRTGAVDDHAATAVRKERGRARSPGPVVRRDVDGHGARHRRPRAHRLRHRAQPGRAAPGRHRPAGRGPAGHPVHQDPGRGPRRRRQAVPPEGHRPGPPGLHPLAQLGRRRRRPRAEAPQLPPADPEEDGPPGPVLRPLRPGRRGAGWPWSTPGAGRCPKTKDAVAALDALGLDGRVLVVLGDDDVVAERSFANLPDRPDHPGVASCPPTTSCATTGSSSPTRPCRVPRSRGRRGDRHHRRGDR